jgi:hypothetical protein
MLSLLYLSHSLIPAGDEMPVVQDIMSVAVRRNLANGITGALVFTGRDFRAGAGRPGIAGRASDGQHPAGPPPRQCPDPRAAGRLHAQLPNWGMAQVASTAEVQGASTTSIAH